MPKRPQDLAINKRTVDRLPVRDLTTPHIRLSQS